MRAIKNGGIPGIKDIVRAVISAQRRHDYRAACRTKSMALLSLMVGARCGDVDELTLNLGSAFGTVPHSLQFTLNDNFCFLWHGQIFL